MEQQTAAAPYYDTGSEEEEREKWHELVDALFQSSREQREAVLASLPQGCRQPLLAWVGRLPSAGGQQHVGEQGGEEEEPHSEEEATQLQQLDARGRNAGGPAPRPTSEETTASSPTAAAAGAEGETPQGKEEETKRGWLATWKEKQRSSWLRVRHPLKDTLLPLWRSLFPSPRTYRYDIETPISCAHKLSLVPLFNSPWPSPVHKIAWSWLGAFVGIAVTGLVAQYALPSDVPSFFAAEGAAATLIYALPDLPTAQPRNMIGGGAISSLLAVAFQKAFASTSLTWLAGALSVATAVAAMGITGTMNPPGGALSLLYIVTPSLHVLGWWYIAVAVMNVLILILVGILVNNIPRAMQYPTYWL